MRTQTRSMRAATGIYTQPALIYRILRRRFGFLNWWPGETKAEILVGAVLTQQTSWKNVEKAIAELKRNNALNIEKLAKMNIRKLERLIRQSGFYRQKASRLKGICTYILKRHGSIEAMFRQDIAELRKELLSLNGVGRETADSIILYASEKPIFVIDAYTRRAMSRISGGVISEETDYDTLRAYFESHIKKDITLYKDFHAQFVELGKNYCKSKPLCEECPLNRVCIYASRENAKQ